MLKYLMEGRKQRMYILMSIYITYTIINIKAIKHFPPSLIFVYKIYEKQ